MIIKKYTVNKFKKINELYIIFNKHFYINQIKIVFVVFYRSPELVDHTLHNLPEDHTLDQCPLIIYY